MHVRTGLLAFCVVLMAGCARDSAPDADRQGAQATASTPGLVASAAMPAVARTRRVAGLPDRGELVAYPGHLTRPDGAYTWYRSDVSEAHALRAIADGHLRLTTPEGQLVDVRYDRHVEHPSGDWTWIGHLLGEDNAQTIITFGERAVFGSIGQPDGKPPLRLTMRDGVSWLVETDPRKAAAIVNAATRPTHPDYHIVNRADLPAAANPRPAAAPIVAPPAAAPIATTSKAGATAANTVDLLVGYTAGFVTAQGSTSAAMTRINYLVDVANAAYVNSQIPAQVRLVGALQVNYTDLNTNDTALEELSGYKSGTGPVTPNAAFNALRAARETYGADLVSLVRPFKDPEQDSCGLAWLLGGSKQTIQPGAGWDDLAYSVIGDGEDVGSDGKTYFCRDETLAHEMGHNEGSAHDRQTAEGTDGVLNDPDDYGAFTYSFGYKTTSTNGNFYTVMAYGDTGQTPYRVFSNPRITFCGGRACGTTTYEDNARSLGQEIPVVATFRATVVPLGTALHNDFDGDAHSDILWRNASSGANVIWLDASSATQQAMTAVPDLTWTVAGTADFDGDGRADVLWRNTRSGANLLWKSGSSASQQALTSVGNFAWQVVGVGDFDGDGKADILWRNTDTGANLLWKSGSSASQQALTPVGNMYWNVAGIADFNGDGKADILWRNEQSGANTIWLSANAATQQAVTTVANSAWTVGGVGDFTGNGRADIFWRNRTTGATLLWVDASSGSQQAMATVGDSAWQPVDVGDYDGDGHADVLWRNANTGANTIWRSANSATPMAVTAVGNLAWRVQGG